jgi:hypothetical protein
MMKTLLLGLVSGILLAACGAPTPEEMDSQEQIGTSEGALCEGWDAGARRCSWKCTSSATLWTSVGVGVVGYGQCQDYANSQCGRTAYSTCWSK